MRSDSVIELSRYQKRSPEAAAPSVYGRRRPCAQAAHPVRCCGDRVAERFASGRDFWSALGWYSVCCDRHNFTVWPDEVFQARFSAAVAGGEAASVRAEHTDEHQIAWAKLRQEAAHDRTVLRTDGQQLHQRPPSGGIRNVHRMVCAAFDQARTLRRIDIQHGKPEQAPA